MIKISENHPSGPLLLKQGLVSGLLAGGVFLLAQMVITRFLGNPFDTPLRVLASLWGGMAVLVPKYQFPGWPLLALVIQAALSTVWGVAFVLLLSWGRQLDAPLSVCVGYGALYGVMLWIANFFIISPVIFPQLMFVNQFWNGFVAHVVFFGAFLGYSYGVSRERPVRRRYDRAMEVKT